MSPFKPLAKQLCIAVFMNGKIVEKSELCYLVNILTSGTVANHRLAILSGQFLPSR
jgi:hypothetical protein